LRGVKSHGKPRVNRPVGVSLSVRPRDLKE
jgi:hypothetical protein